MYRLLPKMDGLLANSRIQGLCAIYGSDAVKEALQEQLDAIRAMIRNGAMAEAVKAAIGDLVEGACRRLDLLQQPRLRAVVNATGTVLHTNLGRSILPEEVMDAAYLSFTRYSNLEFDLNAGKRGSRYTHVEELLIKLTGAEAALVVNNNAAAVLLVLSTLAQGKEVIISRGELIEIGGAFRIPDVMEACGAILREVGTTNKTHFFDYERAICEDTGAILKVHTSNYKICGFSDSVSALELRALADRKGLPLIEDLGSGVLVDLEQWGLPHEPTVQEAIASGVDVVTFSGDKLLGGPQAGILVGKKAFIDRCKRHPLNRALRIDKMTLKVLEEILKFYLRGDLGIRKIPTISMLTADPEELQRRAVMLYNKLSSIPEIDVEVRKDTSEVGGGSLPTTMLPTSVVAVRHPKKSEESLDRSMRHLPYPIIGRLHDGWWIADVRTLLSGDDARIESAVRCWAEEELA